MKWVFVVAGFAMVIIGGIGKYVDMTKYREPFISNMSPYYTIFITGIITVILGLSFDWIMSLDDEEEGAEGGAPEGEGEKPEEEAAEAEEDAEAKPEGEDAEPESAGEPPAQPEETAPEGGDESGKAPSSD